MFEDAIFTSLLESPPGNTRQEHAYNFYIHSSARQSSMRSLTLSWSLAMRTLQRKLSIKCVSTRRVDRLRPSEERGGGSRRIDSCPAAWLVHTVTWLATHLASAWACTVHGQYFVAKVLHIFRIIINCKYLYCRWISAIYWLLQLLRVLYRPFAKINSWATYLKRLGHNRHYYIYLYSDMYSQTSSI